MDAKLELQCTLLARRYHEVKSRKVRNRIRNTLFIELHPFLQLWVRSILIKCNRFETDEEILSLSWQCFVYALERLKGKKNNIPLPKHFHTYAQYYLRKEQEKEMEGREIVIMDEALVNEVKNTLSCGVMFDTDSLALLRAISDLHNSLPCAYKIVMEDALMNLTLSGKDKVHRVKQSGMTSNRYYEARKVIDMVISHMKENHQC